MASFVMVLSAGIFLLATPYRVSAEKREDFTELLKDASPTRNQDENVVLKSMPDGYHGGLALSAYPEQGFGTSTVRLSDRPYSFGRPGGFGLFNRPGIGQGVDSSSVFAGQPLFSGLFNRFPIFNKPFLNPNTARMPAVPNTLPEYLGYYPVNTDIPAPRYPVGYTSNIHYSQYGNFNDYPDMTRFGYHPEQLLVGLNSHRHRSSP